MPTTMRQRIVSSENLPDRHPISYPDVQEMIDFALDCTGLDPWCSHRRKPCNAILKYR